MTVKDVNLNNLANHLAFKRTVLEKSKLVFCGRFSGNFQNARSCWSPSIIDFNCTYRFSQIHAEKNFEKSFELNLTNALK